MTPYVFEEPTQTVAFPLTAPGVAGILIVVTLSVCAVDEPQVLLAVTLTLPLVALEVVTIEFVVDVPVHPPGKAQV